ADERWKVVLSSTGRRRVLSGHDAGDGYTPCPFRRVGVRFIQRGRAVPGSGRRLHSVRECGESRGPKGRRLLWSRRRRDRILPDEDLSRRISSFRGAKADARVRSKTLFRRAIGLNQGLREEQLRERLLKHQRDNRYLTKDSDERKVIEEVF